MNQADKPEFDRQLTRLFQTLSAATPTPEQKQAWFQATEQLEINTFSQAVEQMIAHAEKRSHPVPGQLLAYAKQLAVQTPEQNRTQVPLSDRESARQWLEDLECMLAQARARGPMSESERAHHKRLLDSAPREPKPAMTPCCVQVCQMPGTLSPSTTGGGPWYCGEHFR